jgi:uncharacterized repeat protein (TIGR03803 family)
MKQQKHDENRSEPKQTQNIMKRLLNNFGKLRTWALQWILRGQRNQPTNKLTSLRSLAHLDTVSILSLASRKKEALPAGSPSFGPSEDRGEEANGLRTSFPSPTTVGQTSGLPVTKRLVSCRRHSELASKGRLTGRPDVCPTVMLPSAFRTVAALALAVVVTSSGLASPLTVIHNFDGIDGNDPVGGFCWYGYGGIFYGATRMGGTNGNGTLFGIMAATGAFASLYSFDQGTEGYGPLMGLAQDIADAPNNFVGTTYNGGAGSLGRGAVYEVSTGPASVVFSHIYDFTGNGDGGNPEGALVRGRDGYFYGTTAAAGTNGHGTVFQYNPTNNNLTTLYSFSGTDGDNPAGALIQGNDGYFYGATTYGGISNYGTLFRIGFVSGGPNNGWPLTTIIRFTGGAMGAFPRGNLVLGADGLFYGVTDYGGNATAPTVSGGGGTVFSLTTSGVLTRLHSFGDDYPQPLIQGTDGNFYGTTAGGSSVEPNGTMFQITSSGVFNTLFEFNGTNGSNPAGPLIQYLGTLWGATSQGGSNNLGTIFSLAVPSLGILTNQLVVARLNAQANFPNVGILSAAGLNYQLQAADSMAGTSSWSNAGAAVPGAGGWLNLVFPSDPLKSQQFFRVMISQ